MRPLTIPRSGLTFKVWSQRFSHLWGWIHHLQLEEDWRQEAALITLRTSHLPNSKALGEIYKLWYRFLRSYGFRRTKKGRWVVEAPVSLLHKDQQEVASWR